MSREAKIGEILLYRLSAYDCQLYQERLKAMGLGANSHQEGQVVPLLPTKIWNPNYLNGMALMDGPMPFWVTSRQLGETPGTWSFQEGPEA